MTTVFHAGVHMQTHHDSLPPARSPHHLVWIPRAGTVWEPPWGCLSLQGQLLGMASSHSSGIDRFSSSIGTNSWLAVWIPCPFMSITFSLWASYCWLSRVKLLMRLEMKMASCCHRIEGFGYLLFEPQAIHMQETDGCFPVTTAYSVRLCVELSRVNKTVRGHYLYPSLGEGEKIQTLLWFSFLWYEQWIFLLFHPVSLFF